MEKLRPERRQRRQRDLQQRRKEQDRSVLLSSRSEVDKKWLRPVEHRKPANQRPEADGLLLTLTVFKFLIEEHNYCL